MSFTWINEAEVIIEPFWDGGSSENPTDKQSLLDKYDVVICNGAIAKVSQTWCSVCVAIDRAEPGRTAVVMERKCDLPLEGCDICSLHL